MGPHRLLVRGPQIVDLALKNPEKNAVAVLFEVESNHDYDGTIRKLTCALIHHLIYFRNRNVNTLEMVGFYIPVGEGYIEAVTCTWSRGVARIFLKGVLSLVPLTRPFLQLVRCIVVTSSVTLSDISLET